MNYKSIRFAVEGGLATLTLARPEKLNALTPEMADEMRHALGRCGDARAILMNGEGKAFCSGADLLAAVSRESGGEGAYQSLISHFNPLILEIVEHELPVVAAVTGAVAVT